jgi:hypothetical protein
MDGRIWKKILTKPSKTSRRPQRSRSRRLPWFLRGSLFKAIAAGREKDAACTTSSLFDECAAAHIVV